MGILVGGDLVMSDKLGVGVMLQMFCSEGTKSTKAITHAKGQKIIAVELRKQDGEEGPGPSADQIRIRLGDATTLVLWDGGQSCCEHRYMNTDDDLQEIVGGELKDIFIADGPTEREDGEHGDFLETQFLKIQTTKGEITVANYNSHNGYYGGFYLKAKLEFV